jgi:dTDP-4-amino-4,6-dideoxygalactose transaminase
MVFTNVYNPRCEIPRMTEMRNTLVKRGATLGANSTIMCGITVGAYAFVGAGTVVLHDVPNYALMVGNPAERKGWMCRCGTQLQGSASLICPSCRDSYRRIGEDCIEPVKVEEPAPRVPLLNLKTQYLSIKPDVDRAIANVLDTQVFIGGPEVDALEKEISAYCGTQYAVGVSSGTDALLVSLMALGIKPGDEVITTPFTFFATVGSILRVGAEPVFADIEPTTFNIDPAQVQKVLTPRTKAIIPVHLFGQCAEMRPILEISEKYGIPIVEDAAQAIGSEYKGKRAGSMGTLGCFSFFPSKNLGALGDGGMIITNHENLAETARIIRNQGAKPKYCHKLLGGNFRLDAIHAAVLRVKLNYLDIWTEKRMQNAAYYTKRLDESGLAGMISTPKVVQDRHIFNQYVIRAGNRDSLRKFLKESGIDTEIYYPKPLHLQECLARNRGYSQGQHPVSEEASNQVLALPVFPELTLDQKDKVVDAIVRFYE